MNSFLQTLFNGRFRGKESCKLERNFPLSLSTLTCCYLASCPPQSTSSQNIYYQEAATHHRLPCDRISQTTLQTDSFPFHSSITCPPWCVDPSPAESIPDIHPSSSLSPHSLSRHYSSLTPPTSALHPNSAPRNLALNHTRRLAGSLSPPEAMHVTSFH